MIIEKELISYLISKNIVGSNVFAEVPSNPPPTYIIVERNGGGDVNGLNQALIAIKSVSKVSLLSAVMLSEDVKEAMWEAPEASTISVYHCELNSETNYTNTTTKEYRYLATFNILY